jgi:pimeloyl-ACP methyl ester carboxylesterase
MKRNCYSFVLLFIIIWSLSFYTPVARGMQISYEVGVKEFGALVQTVKYYIKTPIEGLNRIVFWNKKTPKVVIMLHGSGGGPYMFLPLVQKLRQYRDVHLVTVKLEPTSDNPFPVTNLQDKVHELTQELFKDAQKIDIALIGHSLGAHVSGKYIWRTPYKDPKVNVSLFISIAGRLKDAPSSFNWFYEDIKPQMAATWRAIQRSETMPKVYTIYGTEDEIVPEESVHIFNNPDHELTVKGYGHMGILYAPEALDHISAWIGNWSKQN